MGWSLPRVPVKEQTFAWSPWVCVLIIILGLFIGLLVVVLKSPATGLPLLSSGYWLPLTVWIFTSILAVIAVYSFCWEILAIRVWNWNEWCQSMSLMWRKRAHQHLIILNHVFLSADTELLPRLAHTQEENSTEKTPLTLLPEEPLIPGISRFELLLRHLMSKAIPSLLRRYPAGSLQVIIQTSGSNKDRESQSFQRIWAEGYFPWKTEVHFQEVGSSLGAWNQFVGATKWPVLVLAMHYRQSDEVIPEFASMLFLVPPSMLNPGEQRNALRLFRAMPLNTGILAAEIGELQDMSHVPPGKKYLVWHSGLSDASRQSVNKVLSDLSVPLYESIGTGGVIDYDRVYARYGNLAGWAMIGTAVDMAAYGPACQWLLLGGEDEAWAATLGNAAPVVGLDHSFIPSPFPVGSILMALLLNIGLYSLTVFYFPSIAFSWLGITLLLMSLAITLPGIAFVLRRVIAHFQRPSFIRAARQSGKE